MADLPGDSIRIAREYLDSLLVESRIVGAAAPSTKFEFLGEMFETPIMTAALSHIDLVGMARGAKEAGAACFIGMGSCGELEAALKTGAKIIQKALEAPLFYIAANAGLEGSVIVNKVRESEAGTGFDAYKEEYVNMVEAGILDPAKVTRSALQNATSVASTLLTTESVVGIIKEDVPPMPAGGAGGMGMM